MDLQRVIGVLGRPGLLARVGEVREAAAAQISTTWSHGRFQAERGRIEALLAGGRLPEALAEAQALLRRARTATQQGYPDGDYDLACACWLLGQVLRITNRAQHALSYLDEARRRFEVIEDTRPGGGAACMIGACLCERGSCLLSLGHLDEAAAAYEDSIRRAQQLHDQRGLAIAKGQLGTVRLRQSRYQDALDAYAAARELFTRLGELTSIAIVWHQIGRTHRAAGRLDAAEDAYRQALAIEVQLGDERSQAGTLSELGNLYHQRGRLEEAVELYRTAVNHSVATRDAALECRCLNNLGETLRKLRHWDEARHVIRQAISCQEPFGHAAEPWKSWAILASIETGAGNSDVAAQANARARACYLAYRRDGGENLAPEGRIALAATKQLLASDVAGAVASIDHLLSHRALPGERRRFVACLRAIAAGSRDRRLADGPELDYRSAAELLLLIDALDAAAAGAA